MLTYVIMHTEMSAMGKEVRFGYQMDPTSEKREVGGIV